jgi:hypothetical protein
MAIIRSSRREVVLGAEIDAPAADDRPEILLAHQRFREYARTPECLVFGRERRRIQAADIPGLARRYALLVDPFPAPNAGYQTCAQPPRCRR